MGLAGYGLPRGCCVLVGLVVFASHGVAVVPVSCSRADARRGHVCAVICAVPVDDRLRRHLTRILDALITEAVAARVFIGPQISASAAVDAAVAVAANAAIMGDTLAVVTTLVSPCGYSDVIGGNYVVVLEVAVATPDEAVSAQGPAETRVAVSNAATIGRPGLTSTTTASITGRVHTVIEDGFLARPPRFSLNVAAGGGVSFRHVA